MFLPISRDTHNFCWKQSSWLNSQLNYEAWALEKHCFFKNIGSVKQWISILRPGTRKWQDLANTNRSEMMSFTFVPILVKFEALSVSLSEIVTSHVPLKSNLLNKRCPVTQVHLISNIEYCILLEPPWNGGFSRYIGTFYEIHDFFEDFRDLKDGPELPDTF